MKNDYRKGCNDFFSGIVLCVFSAAYFYAATQIKIMKMLSASFLNASSVPKLWGALMFLLGVVLIIRGRLQILRARKDGTAPEAVSVNQWMKTFLAENYAVILMLVVLGLYVFLMEPIGFLLSTVLFLWAEFNILSRKTERRIVLTGILAVIFGAAIYLLFRYAFAMPLPQGILKGII